MTETISGIERCVTDFSYWEAQEPSLFQHDRECLGIYQLKQTEETREFRFMPFRYLEKKGIALTRANYNLVYVAPLEGMGLEEIYTKYNVAHPDDYTGHSLSVSDVVVLNRDGAVSAYYVDSIGFRKVPGFAQEIGQALISGTGDERDGQEKEGTDEQCTGL